MIHYIHIADTTKFNSATPMHEEIYRDALATSNSFSVREYDGTIIHQRVYCVSSSKVQFYKRRQI